MLAKLLCLLCIHYAFDKIFMQTHCVRSFTKIDCVFCKFLTGKKNWHFMLAHLPCWFGVLMVFEKLFKQTHCDSYFTKIHLGFFIIRQVEQVDTMFLLNKCNDLGYIWSLKIDLSKKTVLDISQRLNFVNSWFDQFIKQKLCVR